MICTTRVFRRDIKSWCKRLSRWAADQTIIGASVSIDASWNRPSCKPDFSAFWSAQVIHSLGKTATGKLKDSIYRLGV